MSFKLKYGRNNECSNEEYHGDRKFISSSGLKMIMKDEEKYFKTYILGEQREGNQTAFDFGTYVHALFLEPHLVATDFVIHDGMKRFGRRYDELKLENPDKIVILKSEQKAGQAIMDKYSNLSIAPLLLQDGVAEETYAANLDGLDVKVRTDYIAPKHVLDVKTTSYDIDAYSMSSTVIKYDYDLSAALYLDVANIYNEGRLKEFFFLFANKKSYDIVIARASPEMIENGRRKYRYAIDKYKRLRDEGFFEQTELKERIVDITIPSYGIFNYERKE